MLKQEHHQHSKGMDTHTQDELQHVLIPACELGIERYREFRAARPNWQPKSYRQAGGHSGDGGTKMCAGCRECLSSNKFVNMKPQLMVDSGGLSKGAARPVAISLTKPIQHTRVPVAEIAASCQEMQSLCVSKDPQHYENKGRAMEIMAASKPPLLRPADKEAAMAESTKQSTRLGEEDAEPANSGKRKVVELVVAPVALSEQATSSENMSDDTTITPQMETTSLSECAAGVSHGESPAGARASSSKYTEETLARAEDPILVDNQSLFEYIVASRKIPYGHSYSNLDSTMQKKLQDYYKLACPPCPHCNTGTYVKFRYFNNSGKSSLLQPRYTCRNPDTCMTMQERSGKAGSRDFTLPRPREGQAPRALPVSVNHPVQEKPLKQQPQMIPHHAGSKRPHQELGSLSDAGERSVKLPNTTLSLQTLNGPVPLADMANLQIVESSKARSVHFVKPTEDSISSSLTRTASDEQTGINVRYRTEAMSENGLVVLKQPISVHTITSGNAETGTGERGSKGGKIAEVNICMYIDLSCASSC